MTITQQPITAEDLLRLSGDGVRRELVRGEVRGMTPAGNVHGRVAVNLTIPLGQYVREHGLGTVYAAETGFMTSANPDTVRAPDVAFVSRERVEATGNIEGYWPGAPDLAVEVVSPNDSYTGLEEKVADWLGAGTRMVVVVEPRGRIVSVRRSVTEVEILAEGDVLDGGDVVPGWTLPVAEVFR
ncbi:MAG: Uma2 family endonuclease [Actinomycetota bacterium]|nr:Uma2 family endonuclease [Actinomycetota bacterium]